MRLKKLVILIVLIPLFSFVQKVKTPNEIVSKIKQNVTCEWAEKTVDTFKAGDPNSEVKGIAVCMFADMTTLKKAVELGCNFIITHEPVFYNHLDEVSTYSTNRFTLKKQSLLKKTNLLCFGFTTTFTEQNLTEFR